MSFLATFSDSTRRRLIFAVILIFVLITIGTIGFHLLENLTWLESIYFATATLTTVGYGDIVPHSQGGKIFTTFYMLFGVGTVLYALTILAQAIIQSEVLEALGERRKKKKWKILKITISSAAQDASGEELLTI